MNNRIAISVAFEPMESIQATFLGLMYLLTSAKSFEEAVALAA